MQTNRRTSLLWFYLAGIVSALATLGTLLYVVGALGLFGDPAHTRIVDAVVAVCLLAVAAGSRRLASRLGRR